MEHFKLFAYTTVMVVCAVLFVVYSLAPVSRPVLAGPASETAAWLFYGACAAISGFCWLGFLKKFFANYDSRDTRGGG